METGGKKYKGFWGAKRPKIQKFSRAKRAKTKKKEAFLSYMLAENLLISGYIPGFKYTARMCKKKRRKPGKAPEKKRAGVREKNAPVLKIILLILPEAKAAEKKRA